MKNKHLPVDAFVIVGIILVTFLVMICITVLYKHYLDKQPKIKYKSQVEIRVTTNTNHHFFHN